MAEFKYFLNRQGARGPQGPQGEKGFSPDISVEKDTLSEYVLRITNEGGYFLTANLREHKEDRGGTYIRYDRAKGVMYAGDADPATTDTLGVIRIAKDDDFAGKAEDAAVTPAQIQDYTTAKITEVNQRIDSLDANNVKVTGDQAIDGRKVFNDRIESNYIYTDHVYGLNSGRLFTNEDVVAIGNTQKPTILYTKGSGITLNGNTDYILTQNRVTAGDGVAIEKTTSGIKISSTAQGDVTLAGDNSFTGNNTFDGETTFNTHTWTKEQEAVNLNVTSNATLKNAYVTGTISSLGELTAVSISAAGIKNNQNNKYYLTQASITAGDNVTIEETTDGVKISSTGGGSAPANMVTTDTEQTITGIKTFTGRLLATKVSQLKFENRGDSIVDGASGIEIQDNLGVPIFSRYGSESIIVGYNTYDLSLRGKTIKNSAGKNFLAQGSITAGSDNLVIAETETGIKLVVNAPTDAQFGQLQQLIVDLDTKINRLTDRVKALEEVIDGGVADSIYPTDPPNTGAK